MRDGVLFLVSCNTVGKYDQREMAERLARKRLSEPDEEGWITVTKKAPRNQPVGSCVYWYYQTPTAHCH